MSMIFAIMGAIGSGKQTIAHHFEKNLGFEIINIREKFYETLDSKEDKLRLFYSCIGGCKADSKQSRRN